ncbi:sulfur carrier protein ThiS [Salisediminibacterium beveridgei]|uniref:Thiamine biosynthesis protein ThiS n=1 Tax=Salisediminibacterium beveridgei TaxID=632773 RepID=A0A1D7QX55_9BACI|nr:sulfur carrier protein ThiS [Salisediminibacterium beveridgei]AOM83601.1 thiamine biosynthesis protein ThiS [Salisediminibacterium beveridgei]
MKLLINGKEETLEEGGTVEELLTQYGAVNGRVAVEHNGTILKKEEWAMTPVKDGDKLEIVHFVGGG